MHALSISDRNLMNYMQAFRNNLIKKNILVPQLTVIDYIMSN